MRDEEIIQALRSGPEQKALVQLYAHLPKVERMVRKNSGTHADAKDLFQDALVILLGRAKDPAFTLSCSIGTYLFAICRNKWQEELRRQGRFTQELESAPDEPVDLSLLLANGPSYEITHVCPPLSSASRSPAPFTSFALRTCACNFSSCVGRSAT